MNSIRNTLCVLGLCGLALSTPLHASFGNLIKEAAKNAAKEKVKEEVTEAVVGALTKNSPEYQGPKTYDEAVAAASVLDVPPAKGPVLDSSKDLSKIGAYNKMKKDTNRVAIAGFRVAFITSNAASSSDNKALSNLGNSSSSGFKTIYQDETVKMQLLLQGIEPAQMQAITDAAFQDFVASLQAQSGIEVLPLDSVPNAASFADIEYEDVQPMVKNASVFNPRDVYVFAPTGMPLYFTHMDASTYGNKGPLDQKNWKTINAISTELDAIMVIPQITINFANMDSAGHHNMFKDARVSSRDVISAEANFTNMSVFKATTPKLGHLAMTTLKKSASIEGEYSVRYLVDESDNATLVNSLTRMTGQPGRITRAETWAVVANPSAYQAQAIAAANSVTQAFAEKLTE